MLALSSLTAIAQANDTTHNLISAVNAAVAEDDAIIDNLFADGTLFLLAT